MALKEIGALWPLRSGKPGYSGMIKPDVPAGQRIVVLPNKSDNAQAPALKVFISEDDPKSS